MKTRMLLWSVVGLSLALGAATSVCDADVVWKKGIALEPGRYAAWPTVARAKDGSLVVVFSGDRDAHICPFGKVQMVKSTDGGETWSAPRTIAKTALDDRDAGVVTLPDGRLLVTWFNSVTYRQVKRMEGTNYLAGTKYAAWQAEDRKTTLAQKRAVWGYYGTWSSDGGETWTPPRRLATMRSQTPHGPIVLKDGSLLQFGRRFENDLERMFRGGPEHTTIIAERSTNGGLDWTTLCEEVPGFGNENSVNLHMYHEPHVAELPNGELYGLVRSKKAPGILMRETRSSDGGRTWTRMQPSALSGYPPHLIVLRDGRLLVVYGRRVKDLGGFGEYAALSRDGGRTWEPELRLASAPDSDLGYPASVELDDGTILTVYYQKSDDGKGTPGIWATKWRPRAAPEPIDTVVSVPSAAMGHAVACTVLVPSVAQTNSLVGRRFPVAYLLHGNGNDHRTYVVPAVKRWVEAHGVIVVCPEGGHDWWMDSPNVAGVRRETFVVKELVPFVEAHWPAATNAAHRLLAGHSMGGYGAARLGFRHSDLFGVVGGVMGGMDWWDFPDRADFRRLLGPRDANAARWRDYSVLAEANRLKNGGQRIFLTVGARDFFLAPNRALHARLDARVCGTPMWRWPATMWS